MNNILKLRLHYFPFPGRAGPIRDAFNIGGVAFDDVHVPPDEFGKRKAAGEYPFGGLPVLEVKTTTAHIKVGQSNAILSFAGRLAGLYPADDPIRALRVDEVLSLGEDINELLGPSLHEQDTTKKMAMRKILAEETLPRWIGYIEQLLVANGNTGFIVGSNLSVADLKLYWITDWLTNGSLDGIPTTLLNNFATVKAWFKNIAKVRESRLAK